MNTISEFKGEYAWLSSAHPGHLTYGAVRYPTAEHAFQAAKLPEKHGEMVAACKTVALAKSYVLERRAKWREDWDEVKLPIMGQIQRIKFRPGGVLAERLLKTWGVAELVEGNWHGDTYWGVCKGNGDNHMGEILMDIRSELHESAQRLAAERRAAYEADRKGLPVGAA